MSESKCVICGQHSGGYVHAKVGYCCRQHAPTVTKILRSYDEWLLNPRNARPEHSPKVDHDQPMMQVLEWGDDGRPTKISMWFTIDKIIRFTEEEDNKP